MLGWILLGLLGILLLLLLVPVGLELRYRDSDLRMRARVLGFKVMLFPTKPKKPRRVRRTSPRREAPVEPKEAKPKEPVPMMDLLQTLNDLLPELGRLLGSTLRHVTIKRLRLQLPIGGDDAAEVGIHYGQMQALCYNIYVHMASTVRLREWNLSLQPDWTGEHPASTVGELWVRVTPIAMLAVSLRFLLRGGVILYRSPYIQVNKKTKDGAQNATNPNR